MVNSGSRYFPLIAFVICIFFAVSQAAASSLLPASEVFGLSKQDLTETEKLAVDYARIDFARTLMRQSRFVQAADVWRDIYRQSDNNSLLSITALLASATSELDAMQLDKAENALQLAKRKLANMPQTRARLQSELDYGLGKVSALRFDYNASLQHFIRAKESLSADSALTPQQHDIRQIVIDLAAAETAFQAGKRASVRQQLRFALNSAKRVNYADGELASRSALIAIALRQSRPEQVSSWLIKPSEARLLSKTSSNILLRYAELLTQLPDPYWTSMGNSVLSLVQRLDEIIQSSSGGSALHASALGIKAKFYVRTHQYADAELLLSAAIRSAEKRADKYQLMRWLAEFAALEKSQAKTAQAIQAYRLAVSHLDDIKDGLSYAQGTLYSSDHDLNNIYLALTDLLLHESERQSAGPKRQQLLIEARRILENKKNVELQNYFHDQCIVNFQDKVRSLDELTVKGTAVLYPIVLEDRLELLVGSKGRLTRYVSQVPREQLGKVVAAFRDHLVDVDSRDFLQEAKQLYQWIITPIAADLDRDAVINLVVVSESLLRTVPLSVLYDGKRYLIQKYALAVSPGLSLTDPKTINRKNMQVLLSGISESVQGFPALAYVKGELEEIQDIYANELLLNRDFVTKRFSEALANPAFSVAHIASHSEMGDDSRSSYILTFDGRISMDDLSRMTDMQRRRKPIELLTLSACQTAAGDDRAALGLAGVAVKSGARSALATLWAIDDFASSLLVSEFYKQLSNPALSKAEALRNAQRLLINTRRFGHPAYWSSFLLIGNWM